MVGWMFRTAAWSCALGLGLGLACSDPEPAGTVLMDACVEEQTVACAKVTPSSDVAEHVAVCRDGVLEILLRCEAGETCSDMGSDVAACSDVNGHIPYAVVGAPCSTADIRACDDERDNVLACDGTQWSAAEDCTVEVQRCGVPSGEDVALCTDP